MVVMWSPSLSALAALRARARGYMVYVARFGARHVYRVVMYGGDVVALSLTLALSHPLFLPSAGASCVFTPNTLHPTPYTLHPTPYTLHPTPYTLHPTPYTPNVYF